ncbi:hypothetical protein HH1059_19250 [Halorhodospira halochloris]|uniref:DUF3375 domain-containing protein n=1 Tax=Halorhodospira halochloris TaxID=1052 RepID=A0A0X8XAU6_HALHR|nr:DUF3375 domain-containing protein [Halorhodospira halochloris]MBK1651750.1 hypothetical protein [Halorhodospira halochloris]MCG5548528.1 DUF3375 domain-containing protein [Halorhodospira halochloris]BAU58619.1 hypothetical protein HH1059_19250 [Halorhodospira halochloris]
MDYHHIEALRRHHPAWRLLIADSAPLVLGFMHRAFVAPNRRAQPQGELINALEDYLHHLRVELGEGHYPRSAGEYLNDWAADERGWLRKFYPPATDEPHFDLTPAAEVALGWLEELEERQFVGAESRLLTVFDLLRQMVHGAETDPEARINELERRRAEIDAEIAAIRDGRLEFMDETQLKERYYQVERTARGLLADFRQVEQNFRELDRQVRERITTWGGSKGDLLAEVFGERDAIADSDQGKSFRAFWDFLMSPARQEELTELLERVIELDPVQQLGPDRRLARVHYDWMDAGEETQRTVARLSAQLRKFLDDQAWLENRRIMDLIHDVEQHALAVRDNQPSGDFFAVAEPAPMIDMPMERRLFVPPFRARIEQQVVEEGTGEAQPEALFEQVYVDKNELSGRIRRSLQEREQVELATVIEHYPLEQGLAELVAYLSLASADERAVIDEQSVQVVSWQDPQGINRRARLPRVIFSR